MSQPESNFEPNQEILNVLLSMGISENVGKEALFCTGNKSADHAINYIFNNSSDSNEVCSRSRQNSTQCGDHPSPDKEEAAAGDDEEWEEEDVYFKMTFIVNTSLKMGVGKIAAQVGHACLGLYREMLENNMEDDLSQWEEIGEKKIVLKGNSTEHLIELYDKAKEAKIPAYLVRDAGHTQIPRGSVTVLSLFGLEENIDKISGKLSLL